MNASHCIFYLILEMTTIDKHEYFKMIRAREEIIRTFMRLELEACLEEASWMLSCYNCEVLDCPQEEYSARLLPTPPPSYIDNLQSRLIRARKGTFPASLKMISKTEYQPSVLRPVPKTSVQPDGMKREYRVGENSPSSEYDPSPRRAAVDTRSEEPGTPPQSPAISTGSRPEASQAETQMEEEIFSFIASMDGFLNQNLTSLEQEYILIQSKEEYILLQVQPEFGMDDSNNATTSQAAAREESARLPIGQQQGMTAWSTDQNRKFDRGRLL